jgi:hypothetical protein
MKQRRVFLPNFYFACLVSTNGSSLNALARDGRDVLSGGRDKTEVVGKYMRGKNRNFSVYVKSNLSLSSEFNLITLQNY